LRQGLIFNLPIPPISPQKMAETLTRQGCGRVNDRMGLSAIWRPGRNPSKRKSSDRSRESGKHSPESSNNSRESSQHSPESSNNSRESGKHSPESCNHSRRKKRLAKTRECIPVGARQALIPQPLLPK
jgi:hypothetical protein